MIDSKQQKLTIALPAERISLKVDPLRLSQSISNLLTNAAMYTDANGHVSLSVSLIRDAIRISVKDDGIGLASDVIPNIFQMFSQVDSAIDRAQGGLGIGLALVKGLIELHGGTVEAASGGGGHGSEFTIILPPPSWSRKPSRAGELRKLSRCANLSRFRVLVVDDNRDAA